MIKIETLRINNLVSTLDEEPEILKIEGIKLYDIDSDYTMVKLESFDNWINIANIAPIELNESILFKYGFKWSIFHQAFHLEGFMYVIDICKGFCRVIKNRRTGEVLMEIKYLHELQNLYIDHMKKELIKINK